jgi:hypothetical protein
MMSSQFYNLLAEDGVTVVELRQYPQAMMVGPGAPGEFARMVAVAAPAAAPVPPSPRVWLERLPQVKQQAIMTAALGNAALLLWVMKAAGEGVIDVTGQDAVAGVGALVAAGVLTADDQAVLLAP